MPRAHNSAVLPAHETKHIAELEYPFQNHVFRLTQLDNGLSNGTALWLGAQCLSAFLAHVYGSKHRTKRSAASKRPRAIELGSGIGLSALALSSMGWDVVATDLPAVIDTVLARNVANNNSALPSDSGTIQVRALDWAVPAEQWLWDNDKIIASTDDIPAASPSSDDTTLLRPPFDLIVTADTVYSTELVHPLLQTLQALCKQSAVTSPKGTREPPVHLCLERRDPVLVDYVLAEAAKSWTVKRVPHGKLTRAIEKGGHLWEQSQWEDVEIWTFTQKNS